MLLNRKVKKIKVKDCEKADISEISEILLNQVKQYFHTKSKQIPLLDLHEPPEIHESLECLSGAQLNSVVLKMIQEDELNAKLIGSLVIFFE